MSVQRSGGLNGRALYCNIAKPFHVDFNFTIDASNGNGLGQRSLKSNGYIEQVYCYCSGSPATGSPAPNAGYFVIKMKQNFNYFLGMTGGFVSPTTGSTIKIDNGATLSTGVPYMVAVVGTATDAQWRTIGVPAGVTVAVGVSFIAKATGAGSGNTVTSRVIAAGTSGHFTIEVIGNTGLNKNTDIAANAGQYIVCQCLNASGTPTNPTAGSVFGGQLRFDASSVTIDGI